MCNFLTWKHAPRLTRPAVGSPPLAGPAPPVAGAATTVNRSVWMTRPHITILKLWDRVRARVFRWPSALKVVRYNEPIETYNLYISDFLYRRPKIRSIYWPPHYKPMGEKSTGSFLTNTRRNSNLYHAWHQSWPSQTLDAILAMCPPWGHVTSSSVTKMFLPIASHRKELQHRVWSHCVQLIKTHRMIYILTLRSR